MQSSVTLVIDLLMAVATSACASQYIHIWHESACRDAVQGERSRFYSIAAPLAALFVLCSHIECNGHCNWPTATLSLCRQWLLLVFSSVHFHYEWWWWIGFIPGWIHAHCPLASLLIRVCPNAESICEICSVAAIPPIIRFEIFPKYSILPLGPLCHLQRLVFVKTFLLSFASKLGKSIKTPQ